MKQPYAVIDMGTNTFHLLIARPNGAGTLEVIERRRIFVSLAEAGIEKIGPAPYQRAVDAIRDFHAVLQRYGLPNEKVRVFGTAAMRSASNGAALAADIKEKTGLSVQLIDGIEEARLIQLGVAMAVPPSPENQLIMDVGGGSVEFILANQNGLHWSGSFPIGVAVLYRRFHRLEPIAQKDIEAERSFLREELRPLQEVLREMPCRELVGASGTFDVLEYFLSRPRVQSSHSAEVPLHAFPHFYQRVLAMDKEQRRRMSELPPARADLLSVALVLVGMVIELARIERVIVSDYAMKEGMISEMVHLSSP